MLKPQSKGVQALIASVYTNNDCEAVLISSGYRTFCSTTRTPKYSSGEDPNQPLHQSSSPTFGITTGLSEVYLENPLHPVLIQFSVSTFLFSVFPTIANAIGMESSKGRIVNQENSGRVNGFSIPNYHSNREHGKK